MVMPGRNYSSDQYRFGFNGQEKVDEISGNGNHNTAEYWEYETRLSRRWNIDPILKFNESPYSSFSNNPLWFTDNNGADTTISNNKKGNVIVWLTDNGNEVDYANESKQNNWDIIETKNSIDAANRLKAYKAENKLNNLVIRTHGLDAASPSSFALKEFEVDSKTIDDYTSGNIISKQKKEFLDGIISMQNLVDNNGNVYYTACNAGLDRKLVGSLGNLLNNSENTGVSLFFNTGRSQYYKPNYSLSSSVKINSIFDLPLLHPSTSKSIWISVERNKQLLIFQFGSTSPGLKSNGDKPIGNYKYK